MRIIRFAGGENVLLIATSAAGAASFDLVLIQPPRRELDEGRQAQTTHRQARQLNSLGCRFKVVKVAVSSRLQISRHARKLI
jgi:hypothetical protein